MAILWPWIGRALPRGWGARVGRSFGLGGGGGEGERERGGEGALLRRACARGSSRFSREARARERRGARFWGVEKSGVRVRVRVEEQAPFWMRARAAAAASGRRWAAAMDERAPTLSLGWMRGDENKRAVVFTTGSRVREEASGKERGARERVRACVRWVLGVGGGRSTRRASSCLVGCVDGAGGRRCVFASKMSVASEKGGLSGGGDLRRKGVREILVQIKEGRRR